MSAAIFLLMNGLVISQAVLLTRLVWPRVSGVDRFLTVCVVALTQIIATEMILGLVGHLRLGPVLAAQGLLFAVTFFLTRTSGHRSHSTHAPLRGEDDETLNAGGVSLMWTGGVLLFLVLTLLGMSLLNPPVSYDSLYVHLVLPAEWFRSGSLWDIASHTEQMYTWFLGLWSLWLILPFASDVLARFGQAPFTLLSVPAVYAIARKLGAPPRAAFLSGALLLAFPAFISQGLILADKDNILTGMFLLALNTLLLLRHDYTRRMVLLTACALGLLGGTKLLAFLYGLPLVLLTLGISIAGRRRDNRMERSALLVDLVLLSGIVLFLAGPPFLVTRLTQGTWEIPWGLYLWSFNLAKLLNRTTAIWGGLALILMSVMWWLHWNTLRNRRTHGVGTTRHAERHYDTVMMGLFMLMAVYIVAACSVLSPNSWEMRYLFPALALVAVGVGIVLDRVEQSLGTWIQWIPAALVTLGAWVALQEQFRVHRPVTGFAALGLAGVLTLAAGFIVRRSHSKTSVLLDWTGWKRIGLLCMLTGIGLTLLEPIYLDWKYSKWPPWYGYGHGWMWVDQHTRAQGARIAYTGLPLIYPLYGIRYQNAVMYISPLDGTVYRGIVHPTFFETTLAGANYTLWEARLNREGVRYLYISRFCVYDTETFRLVFYHDRFPMEATWAETHPERFKLVYTEGLDRIYEITKTP